MYALPISRYVITCKIINVIRRSWRECTTRPERANEMRQPSSLLFRFVTILVVAKTKKKPWWTGISSLLSCLSHHPVCLSDNSITSCNQRCTFRFYHALIKDKYHYGEEMKELITIKWKLSLSYTGAFKNIIYCQKLRDNKIISNYAVIQYQIYSYALLYKGTYICISI